MAAAAITIVATFATIESDSTGAVITNGSSGGAITYRGELRNHGPADVFIFVSQTSTSAATSSIVTTLAQNQNQIPLPAGATIPITPSMKTIAHKTAAGTATLSWVPYN